MASELFAGGHLLLEITEGKFCEALLLPCVIEIYHDLFVNVGYWVDAEAVFHGQKNGVDLDVVISRYQKPLEA